MRRASPVATLAACIALLAVPSAALGQDGFTAACEIGAYCGAVSEDGTRVVFPFADALAVGGGGEHPQIYERYGGVTRALVSYPDDPPNPTYAALLGTSADVRHVFVWTNLPLVAEDLDGGTQDIYDIHDGTAALLSTGPLDPQSSISSPGGPFLMSFSGASDDGRHVFLNTQTGLLPEDTDGCPDVYERADGQTRLVSTGPTSTATYIAPQCDLATYGGLSADGSHVFFTSHDHLSPDDVDGGLDIYQRVGGTVAPLTTYPASDGLCVDIPRFGAASADGGRVLFSTSIPISPEDHDGTYDVYRREADGTFILISRSTDETPASPGCAQFRGDRPVALSADGRTAIFETTARLTAEDHDSSPDLYTVTDGAAVSLVTTGLTDPGLDDAVPVQPAWPAQVSDDAVHVAFESRQALVAADGDGSVDVYVRSGGVTELVSTGPEAGAGAAIGARLLSISGDGGTVAFATRERLTAADGDDETDIYVRRAGGLNRPGQASSSKLAAGAARTILISAESIAPQMRIARHGRLLGPHRIGVRLSCPKAETSGPCHGVLRLVRRGSGVGRATFRVSAGHGRWVGVRLRSIPPAPGTVLRALVRGVDRLGNREDVSRRVALSR